MKVVLPPGCNPRTIGERVQPHADSGLILTILSFTCETG